MSESNEQASPEESSSGESTEPSVGSEGMTSESSTSAPSETGSAQGEVLRWWPGALLLIVMILVRSIAIVIDSPPMPLMMFSFMGPAVIGLMLLLWWLFASRATWGEKFTILGAASVIGVACCLTLHRSLGGFGIPLMVLPAGVGAFTFGLLVTASRRSIRLPVTMFFTLIGFGSWSLLQTEGYDGKFKPEFLWRWSETAEDTFLASMSERETIDAEPVSVESLTLSEAQWPGFRGRDRMGSVSGVSLSEDWDGTPPKEIWRTPVGPAWSSFSVAGSRLYTQEQRDDFEAVVCLDAESGAIIWDYETKSRFWEGIAGAGPRATPTVDAAGVYAFGGEGVLVCLNAATGEEIWKRDVKTDASRKPPTWGFAASPLVTESLVIVHAGGEGEKGIFAFDKTTGEPVWSAPSGSHSYSSAQAASFSGVSGVLMLTNDGLQFLNAEDGSEIWQHPWKKEDYRVVQPYVNGETVVLGGSLGTGSQKITVKRSGGGWSIKEDWTTPSLKPDYNDFVVFEDHAYGFDSGIFCCVDLSTGDRAWKRGRYGNGQVLLLADQGQLLVASEKGEIVLVRATPEKLVEVAKFQAIEGKTWNHPVLIGNRLYVRNAREAACFEMPLQ
ncbi:MAG: PQQ-binding-like beta-propeller repeat protein [Planctomycetota bacterium]